MNGINPRVRRSSEACELDSILQYIALGAEG